VNKLCASLTLGECEVRFKDWSKSMHGVCELNNNYDSKVSNTTDWYQYDVTWLL